MSGVDRPKLGLFPDAPRGANVFSRYIAYHFLSGNSSIRQTRNRLLGHRGMDVFGNRFRKLYEIVPLGAQVAISNLLLEATPIGFYGAALPEVRLAMWTESTSPPTAIKEFAPDGGNRPLVKRNLHFCVDCTREDEETFGLAYWRVVHQLPGVHHCPTHATPLNNTCSACDKSPGSGNDWNPPSLTCPFCRGSEFNRTDLPVSSPYEIYLSMVDDIYRRKDVGLAPHKRVLTYAKFMASLPGVNWSEKVDQLLSFVLKTWGCPSVETLADRLEAPFNRSFLEHAISGEDAIVNPAGHLAIMASIHALPPDRPTLSASEEFVTAESMPDDMANTFAARCGLAPSVAARIIDGQPTLEISLKCRVSPSRIDRLRRELKMHGLLLSGQRDGTVVRRRPRPMEPTTRLQLYRERLTHSLSANPSASRSMVAKEQRTAYYWSYKHDRAWLEEKLPARRRSK